jgi:hypothetical protein
VRYLCGKVKEGLYEESEFFITEYMQFVLLRLHLQFCENDHLSDSLYYL